MLISLRFEEIDRWGGTGNRKQIGERIPFSSGFVMRCTPAHEPHIGKWQEGRFLRLRKLCKVLTWLFSARDRRKPLR